MAGRDVKNVHNMLLYGIEKMRYCKFAKIELATTSNDLPQCLSLSVETERDVKIKLKIQYTYTAKRNPISRSSRRKNTLTERRGCGGGCNSNDVDGKPENENASLALRILND